MIPLFFGKIINDKIELSRQLEFDVLKKRLEGREIALTLSKRSYKRSNKQNRLYFVTIVDFLAEELGYDTDYMHEIIKAKCSKRKVMFRGELIDTVRSTTSYDTKEFGEFIERVKDWSARDLKIIIPEQEEIKV